VDPRLKDRAEEAAKNLSHDLPLTVNDQVLSFLNFFQTPRGRAIVETGLRRAGRYREMIFARAAGRRDAAGFDLSGAGGKRFFSRWRCRAPGRAVSGNLLLGAVMNMGCVTPGG